MSWYAAKTFHNKTTQLSDALRGDGVHHYVPEVIGSVVFMECGEEYLRKFEQQHFANLWVYRNPGSSTPTVIPDKEMEMFLFVCTAGEHGLTYLGDDRPVFRLFCYLSNNDLHIRTFQAHLPNIQIDLKYSYLLPFVLLSN